MPRTTTVEQALSGHRIDRRLTPDRQAPRAIPGGSAHVAASTRDSRTGRTRRTASRQGVHVEADVGGEGRVIDGHGHSTAVRGKADSVVDVLLVRVPPLPHALAPGRSIEVPKHVDVLDEMRQNFQCKRASCNQHLGNFQGNTGLCFDSTTELGCSFSRS